MLITRVLTSIFALILLAATSAGAAEMSWRDVQRELKEREFYFGKVDGLAGPETRDALRRFQIREGLEVTGERDDSTLAALRTRKAGELQTWYAPMVASKRLDDEPLTLEEIFVGTQLADAPEWRRRAGLREVQRELQNDGFYDGNIDGAPGPETHQALLKFQASAGLPQTAAADSETLVALGLSETTLATRTSETRRSRARRSSSRSSRPHPLRRAHREIERVFRKIF